MYSYLVLFSHYLSPKPRSAGLSTSGLSEFAPPGGSTATIVFLPSPFTFEQCRQILVLDIKIVYLTNTATLKASIRPLSSLQDCLRRLNDDHHTSCRWHIAGIPTLMPRISH